MGRSANYIATLLIAWTALMPSATSQAPSDRDPRPAARTEVRTVEILNGARVYYPGSHASGDTCKVTRVGIVRSLRVFESIPEYQEIKRRDLDPNSAEYLLYMKRASDKFKDAIARTAANGRYEIIAEAGAIATKDGPIVDLTDEILRNL